jgi:uncharacterized protein
VNARSKLTIHRELAFAVALLLFAPFSAAADRQSIPRLEGRVTDVAKVLSEADRDRLSSLLARYERETSHQIAVLTIPSLLGESIESFSLRVANSWSIGHKDFNDGILITLAMKERRIRIELGLGMEKFITNATAQSIIETSMVPAFRNNDYAGGLESGLKQLMKEARKFVIKPEPQGNRKR